MSDTVEDTENCLALQQYIDLIVNACAGLPLALKVMGATLRGVNDRAKWQVRVWSWISAIFIQLHLGTHVSGC